MGYRKQLRQIRQARRVARAQQQQLFALEMQGIVALTLHSATQTLLVPIERDAGAQVVTILYEALRDRRQILKADAQQLLQAWWENENLQNKARNPIGQPLAGEDASA